MSRNNRGIARDRSKPPYLYMQRHEVERLAEEMRWRNLSGRFSGPTRLAIKRRTGKDPLFPMTDGL